ncbi:MAG: hypothetical protein PHT99_01595 [Methanoregula sp.]|nr:hypothetical protein [Methanoregula sp.]
MAKGRPPYQALKEVKAIARRQGRLCENTNGRGLLYDIAVHLALLIIYIRVHRMKREALTMEEIVTACGEDIARIRRVPPTPGLVLELWVRSPNGTWRFFIVLEDRIVEIPAESLPGNAGTRPIRENAPGPDQSAVSSAFPVRREGFICPFTVPSPLE